MSGTCQFPGCPSPEDKAEGSGDMHGPCLMDGPDWCLGCGQGAGRDEPSCHDFVAGSPTVKVNRGAFLIDLTGEVLTEWDRSVALHPNTLDLPDGTGGGGRETWRNQAQASCDRAAREGRLTVLPRAGRGGVRSVGRD